MKKMLVLLMMLLLAIVLGSINCSNNEKESYQRGYETGYTQGREASLAKYETSLAEAKKLCERNLAAAYQEGYKKGVDESALLSGPKDELVKVLSYNLVRGTLDWIEVVGELQSLSNRQLYVTVTGALLNSNGEIISTGYQWHSYVGAQQKAFFKLDGFHAQPQAVDARLTVTWQ